MKIAVALLAVSLAVALLMPACCKPGDSSGWCKAEAVVVDCAKQLASGGVLDDVIKELADGGGNLIGNMLGFVAKYGAAAVECAVSHSELIARASVPAGRHAKYLPAGLKIAERAKIWRAYLAANGGGK